MHPCTLAPHPEAAAKMLQLPSANSTLGVRIEHFAPALLPRAHKGEPGTLKGSYIFAVNEESRFHARIFT